MNHNFSTIGLTDNYLTYLEIADGFPKKVEPFGSPSSPNLPPLECITCKKRVGKVFNLFKTDYEIGILYFNKHVCPKLPNPVDCVTKTTEWWPYLSQIIYSDQAPKYVCKALDPNCTSE